MLVRKIQNCQYAQKRISILIIKFEKVFYKKITDFLRILGIYKVQIQL